MEATCNELRPQGTCDMHAAVVSTNFAQLGALKAQDEQNGRIP